METQTQPTIAAAKKCFKVARMSVSLRWSMPARWWLRFGALFAALLLHVSPAYCAAAAESEAESLMNKAQAAHLKGDAPVALELATKAVEAAPRNPQCYYVRGRIYATQAEHQKALDDFDRTLKLEPRGA